MNQPKFFIYRNTNTHLIKRIMNNIEWESNNETKDLSKADSFTAEQLQAMRLVARMKEAADKSGAGFVGGFISPTGERFMMSNVEADDIQQLHISSQLDQIQEEIKEKMNHKNIMKLIQEFEG